MLRQTHPRRQGDLGEAAAIEWLTRQGAGVWVPLFHSPDVDLIAEVGDALLRVQVKTCTNVQGDRFHVQICTRGGNQSWSGVTKRFDPTRCEYLFVLVEGGRKWFIPANRLGGSSSLLLGGPRYAEREVDTGAEWQPLFGGPSLDSPALRGDTEAVKRDAL